MFDASKAISQLQSSDRGNFIMIAFCYIICNIINLFNFFTDKVKLAYNNSMDKAYKALLNNVNQTLLESGYSQVNLAGLFFSLNRPKNEKTPTLMF